MSETICILCRQVSHYTDPDACYAKAYAALENGDIVSAGEWRALANDLSERERPR